MPVRGAAHTACCRCRALRAVLLLLGPWDERCGRSVLSAQRGLRGATVQTHALIGCVGAAAEEIGHQRVAARKGEEAAQQPERVRTHAQGPHARMLQKKIGPCSKRERVRREQSKGDDTAATDAA